MFGHLHTGFKQHPVYPIGLEMAVDLAFSCLSAGGTVFCVAELSSLWQQSRKKKGKTIGEGK